MAYWLVKSEPDVWAWDHHLAKGVEPWTGVRNHQAKLHLQAMRLGDQAFFYHSNTGKAVVGVVEVVREAYPDPTAEAGPWVCVDLRALHPLPAPVTLQQIKAHPELTEMALRKLSRLSVSPVREHEWDHVMRLSSPSLMGERQ